MTNQHADGTDCLGPISLSLLLAPVLFPGQFRASDLAGQFANLAGLQVSAVEAGLLNFLLRLIS